jgi:hypothetical protein
MGFLFTAAPAKKNPVLGGDVRQKSLRRYDDGPDMSLILVLALIGIVALVLLSLGARNSEESSAKAVERSAPGIHAQAQHFQPETENRRTIRPDESAASARGSEQPPRDADVAAMVARVRLVNVTPEAERERVPRPREGAPVIRKVKGPTAEYCGTDAEAAAIVERLGKLELLAIDIETTPKAVVPLECAHWSSRVRALHPKTADIRLLQVYGRRRRRSHL